MPTSQRPAISSLSRYPSATPCGSSVRSHRSSEKTRFLCDFTSLKVAPVAAMLESEAQVIGLHPMFGPTALVHCTPDHHHVPGADNRDDAFRSQGIFLREGAVCTIATPEEHDRMMAIVQGLTHFVTICMADSIRRLGIDIGKTGAFMSPVYQIELSLVGQAPLAGPGALCRYTPAKPVCARGARRVPVGRRRTLGDRAGRRSCGVCRILLPRHPAPRHLLRTRAELTDALIECMVKK